MRVSVLAFGKLKTAGLREAANYYARLLKPWVTFQEIELKPLPVSEKSAAVRARIQGEETDFLLKRISTQCGGTSAIYLLDERGRARPTSAWAQDVRDWEATGPTELVFCIGSSLGFGDEIRARARDLLSFGPQTLSHELARVVLLEQLFRAWSVTRGHPYHNES